MTDARKLVRSLHSSREHIDHHHVCCARFSGGRRIVDIGDPPRPAEVGHFITTPAEDCASPQSDDVDDRGLVYLLDRDRGLDIIEFLPNT